jgi:hypothetical protein
VGVAVRISQLKFKSKRFWHLTLRRIFFQLTTLWQKIGP